MVYGSAVRHLGVLLVVFLLFPIDVWGQQASTGQVTAEGTVVIQSESRVPLPLLIHYPAGRPDNTKYRNLKIAAHFESTNGSPEAKSHVLSIKRTQSITTQEFARRSAAIASKVSDWQIAREGNDLVIPDSQDLNKLILPAQADNKSDAMTADIDLSDVLKYMEPGKIYAATITGEALIANEWKSIENEIHLIIDVKVPHFDQWYVGDGHVHTEWSDGDHLDIRYHFPFNLKAGFKGTSIDDRVNSAFKQFTFDWLAISDHAQQLDGDFQAPQVLDQNYPTGSHGEQYGHNADAVFQAYAAEIDNFSLQPRPHAVLKALEYSTRDPRYVHGNLPAKLQGYKDAHLLVYGLESTQFLPDPQPYDPVLDNYTGQFLLDSLVNSGFSNTAGRAGVGVIAHPYSPLYPWFGEEPIYHDWNSAQVDSDKALGLEIVSGGDVDLKNWKLPSLEANSSSIKQWNAMLDAGRRVFCMSDSDDHVGPMFGRFWTYVNIPNHKCTPINVLKAIREGRTIASTGPFLSITLIQNGHEFSIGDTAKLNTAAPLSLRVVWRYLSGPMNNSIQIHYKYSQESPAGEISLKFIPKEMTSGGGWITAQKTFPLPAFRGQFDGYLRAYGGSDHVQAFPPGRPSAYTSPIYLKAD